MKHEFARLVVLLRKSRNILFVPFVVFVLFVAIVHCLPNKQWAHKKNTGKTVAISDNSGNSSKSQITNLKIKNTRKIIPDEYIISGIKGDNFANNILPSKSNGGSLALNKSDPEYAEFGANTPNKSMQQPPYDNKANNTTGFAIPVSYRTPFPFLPIPPPIIVIANTGTGPTPPSPPPKPPVPIPEPSSIIFGLMGLSGILGFRKKTL